MASREDIINRGSGEIKRYRDYYGNPIPGGEVSWKVETDAEGTKTLYHYGVALCRWRETPSGRVGWLTSYSLDLSRLTRSDSDGITIVLGMYPDRWVERHAT